MNNKVTRKLSILIVNHNMSARSELKNMLATLEQPDVDLLRDGRDLVGRELSFKYDLIFIREDLGYSLSGVDLVRYLTRSNLVPKWCKFVIISDKPDAIVSTPIFRHLRTEVLESPLNYQMLENVINATIQSLAVFQKLLRNLNHMAPSILIKRIKSIDASQFDATHKDELLELKIKLLLQGRRPDLATGVAEKISLDSDRIREQLFISFTTGQERVFNNTIDAAQLEGILERGCVYYQTYHSLVKQEPELAVRLFEQLQESSLHPNEMECHALLLQKAQGLAKALEYLAIKEEIKTEGYDLRNAVSQAKLTCYSVALISDNTGTFNRDEILTEMVALIANNTWSKGSFRYNMYKPFILLGMATFKGKSLGSNFDKLYNIRHQLDVKQLNMLLFIAQKNHLISQAIEIHKMLDRNAARLEMSPELISYEIIHREIMQRTISKTEQAQRFQMLGDQHRKAGRVYRALRKYYFCHTFFGSTDSEKLKILALMHELRLKKYWDFKALQVMDSLKSKELDGEQQAVLDKCQQVAC